MESRRLGGQRHLLFPLLRPMVGDGEAQEGGGARRILVAEPEWFGLPAGLRTLPARLGVYLCLPVHVDSLHSESDDRAPGEPVTQEMFRVPNEFSTHGEFLFRVRTEIEG